MWTKATAVGALLASILLASCASYNPASGPLQNDPGNGSGPMPPVGSQEECVEVKPGHVLSYGFESFHNSGGRLTITKVGLADDHDIRILRAWLVPLTGNDSYGVYDGYPPVRHLAPGVQWQQRRHADGAVVPHSRPQQLTNVVLVLKPLKKLATALAVIIYYKDSGRTYHLEFITSIRLEVGHTQCKPGPV